MAETKHKVYLTSRVLRWLPVRTGSRLILSALFLWLTLVTNASARTVLNSNDPLCFFSTLADKLLRNSFSFGVTNIPAYVNGQFVYTPAVNRVLQLAANVYDASTNSFYPHVFRPTFLVTCENGFTNIYIDGYVPVSNVSGAADGQLSLPVDITALTILPSGICYTNNVYGVPWIIGAKKGFPNFNKFGMQTIVQVERKLQIRRSTIPTDIHSTTFLTNQLLSFSISNYANAECWNSYTNPYPNPVQIYAADTLSMAITNGIGAPSAYFSDYLVASNTLVAQWPGFTNSSPALSFANPLSEVAILLRNSDFYFGSVPPGVSGFFPNSSGYGWESNNFDLRLPEFGLLATNRLQLYMLDYSNNVFHVIDYVQFSGPQTALDITGTIEGNNPPQLGYGSNMWSTATDVFGQAYGIHSQIEVSEVPISAFGGTAYWLQNATTEAMIDGFCSFMGLSEVYNTPQNNPIFLAYATNYVAQVPFTPTVTISDYTAWQVNDPLVHYLTNDLTFYGTEKPHFMQTGIQASYGKLGDVMIYPSFNAVNDRYQPWGDQFTNNLPIRGTNAIVPSAYALSLKDPLVWGSDYWDFPTNLLADLTGLGQVHRGTPWQTIYLKADDVLNILDAYGDINSGTNTWVTWTGDYVVSDAATMAPVSDRQLASLLILMLGTNDVTQLMSVNDNNISDWLNVLNDITVSSNSANFPPFRIPRSVVPPTTFDTYEMVSNSAQAQLIANDILETKAVRPDYIFQSVGDLLSAPELTVDSPWLNTSNVNQLIYGITDAAYEAIPAQLLLRLRPDSIGGLRVTNGGVNLQFSGSDALTYVVQESTDLVHWRAISTNNPVQGVFNVPIASVPCSSQQFYRSLLLP